MTSLLNITSSEFTAPYMKGVCGKKRTLVGYMRQPGIYIIKENGLIVYVGMSKSCVVKACYRHFEYWNNRLTYIHQLGENDYSVMIIPVSAWQVEAFERALIVTLKPRDNKNKLELISEPLLKDEDDDLPF